MQPTALFCFNSPSIGNGDSGGRALPYLGVLNCQEVGDVVQGLRWRPLRNRAFHLGWGTGKCAQLRKDPGELWAAGAAVHCRLLGAGLPVHGPVEAAKGSARDRRQGTTGTQ